MEELLLVILEGVDWRRVPGEGGFEKKFKILI
jgi:hypothetical protein